MIDPNAAQDAAAPDDEAGEGEGVSAPQPKAVRGLAKYVDMVNIAGEIDAGRLATIGREVVEGFEIDLESRKAEGWEENYKEGLNLARQVKEDKTFPWAGASNVKFPLITVAAIQFAARAYPAIVDGYNVVKGKVLGRPDDAKQDRADRIGAHMTWQLLDHQPEWEEDTDAMLHLLPIVGTMYRKTWFDPVRKRNASEMVGPDDLVVNYWAKAEPPRMTQICRVYPSEVLSRVRAGTWLEITLGAPEGSSNDKDAPHIFLEQHRELDLDDDGLGEPYIVTVHRETGKVVRVVARFDADGIDVNAKGEVIQVEPVKYFTKYIFLPSLDGSYYGTGFGLLLNPLNQSVDSLINQLIDAGTLSNLQAGFISEGVSMKGGIKDFRPGEWKRVSTGGALLKDSVVPLPVRDPSEVLFKLLSLLIDAAKDISAVKDILTGETQGSNQAVGTTLAMIEQGLKVFTAIYKRLHRSLKRELALNYRLNSLYLSDEEYFEFQDAPGVVARSDYNGKDVNVVPVSDPTAVTDMQKMARAQFLLSFRGQPGIDDTEINKRTLRAGSIEDIDQLFRTAPAPPPPEFVLKGHELELKQRQVDINEAQSKATIALTEAQAMQLNLQTRMADPQFYATLREMIMATIQEAIGGPTDGAGTNDGAGLGGMAGPAADPGISPLPSGPPPEAGGDVGGGATPVTALPSGGGDPGAAQGPQF